MAMTNALDNNCDSSSFDRVVAICKKKLSSEELRHALGKLFPWIDRVNQVAKLLMNVGSVMLLVGVSGRLHTTAHYFAWFCHLRAGIYIINLIRLTKQYFSKEYADRPEKNKEALVAAIILYADCTILNVLSYIPGIANSQIGGFVMQLGAQPCYVAALFLDTRSVQEQAEAIQKKKKVTENYFTLGADGTDFLWTLLGDVAAFMGPYAPLSLLIISSSLGALSGLFGIGALWAHAVKKEAQEEKKPSEKGSLPLHIPPRYSSNKDSSALADDRTLALKPVNDATSEK